MVIGSLAATMLVLEVLLRIVPGLWPLGTYGLPRFDPGLQLNVHGAPVVYARGRWTLRTPNRDGFMDVDHAVVKSPPVVRVGFFGDSYVEALQVPLDDTFFRKLPTAIAGRIFEPFAFGISGWGTLQSLLAYRVEGPRYDLDEVVYVFVHNDPGDNFAKIEPDQEAAAEIDDGDGFVVRIKPPADAPVRSLRAGLERWSLLARLIRVQWAGLRAVTERSQRAATTAVTRPDRNDYPSTWPPATLAEAETLTRRILREFRDEVIRDGRRFAVLYVPRGDGELDGKLRPQEIWRPFLAETCAELGIPLWDPTAVLGARQRTGTVIYDDHWSSAGHALIASFIADQLAAERSSATALQTR